MEMSRHLECVIEKNGAFTTLKVLDYPREAYSICIRMVIPEIDASNGSNVLHFHMPPDALVETPREEWPTYAESRKDGTSA